MRWRTAPSVTVAALTLIAACSAAPTETKRPSAAPTSAGAAGPQPQPQPPPMASSAQVKGASPEPGSELKFTTEQLDWRQVAEVEGNALAEPRVFALKERSVLVAGRKILELSADRAEAKKRLVHGLPGTRKRHDWAIAGMYGSWESQAWVHLVFTDGQHTSSSLYRWRGWWVRILGPGDAGQRSPYIDRPLAIVGGWPAGGVLGAYGRKTAQGIALNGFDVMGAHHGPVHPATLHLGSVGCSVGYQARAVALQGERLVVLGRACAARNDGLLSFEPGSTAPTAVALPTLAGRVLKPVAMDVQPGATAVVGTVGDGPKASGFLATVESGGVDVVRVPVVAPIGVLRAGATTWIVESGALWRVQTGGTTRFTTDALTLIRVVRGHDGSVWLEAKRPEGRVVILRAPTAG